MKKKMVIKIIIILSIIVFGYELYKLYRLYTDVKENTTIINKIKSEIDENKIDINYLKGKNPDTVAYLKVNNTSIDYVVVKTQNNDYYLKHNFNKKYSSAGWVFADYRNNFDGNDKNIIVYGHNMLNGSMFGTLKRVLSKDWYSNEDNYIITFITKEGYNYYEVFSIYNIPKEDYYIKTEFKNNIEYSKFIKTITKRSIYNFNIDVEETDQILTLSTCSNSGKNRVVVHARKIDNKISQN